MIFLTFLNDTDEKSVVKEAINKLHIEAQATTQNVQRANGE